MFEKVLHHNKFSNMSEDRMLATNTLLLFTDPKSKLLFSLRYFSCQKIMLWESKVINL